MTKIRCVIRETLNGTRNLTTTREVGSQNVGGHDAELLGKIVAACITGAL